MREEEGGLARRMDAMEEEMARLRVENLELKNMMAETVKHELKVACKQKWEYDPEEERFCSCRQVGSPVYSKGIRSAVLGKMENYCLAQSSNPRY